MDQLRSLHHHHHNRHKDSCISIDSSVSEMDRKRSRELELELSWRRLQLCRSKLKQASKTSALFSGFAMVAMVEVNFNNDPENPVPPLLLILFGVCTTLLVSVHVLSLIISTCILPSVESIALLECKEAAQDSPHERLRFFIELAWTLSSVIGVFLFFLEVIILIWAKFWEMGQPRGEPGKVAAAVSTVIFFPFMLAFLAFAVYFYSKLAAHKYESSSMQIRELEHMMNTLDNTTTIPTITNTNQSMESDVPNRRLQSSSSSSSRTQPNGRNHLMARHSTAIMFGDHALRYPTMNLDRKRASLDTSYAYYNPTYITNE